MSKISIIGAGNIGRTIAYILSGYQKICNEVVLCDIAEGLPQGTALDILQAAAVYGSKIKLIGTNDYKDIANSDVIIVSAGMPRKPGMTREDLIAVNLKITKDISENIKKYSPDAFIIIITNPLDAMVHAAHKYIGCPKHKIVGMAGVLDSARLNYQISQILNVETQSIQTMVIGAHNDVMVPLLRYSTISGISFNEFIDNGTISQEQAQEIIQKVRTGGAEIVGLLKTGSAYFTPAAAAVSMADCYINNHAKIISCSTLLENGEYGVQEKIFVGVPVLLNNKGVEKIIQLDLTKEEQDEFNKSVASINDLLKTVAID